MNEKTYELLVCPVCHGELIRHGIRRRHGRIASGTLTCQACALAFPILFGRPLMVHPNLRQEWTPAYEEAVGWEDKPRNIEKFVAWLGKVGMAAALEAVAVHRVAVQAALRRTSRSPLKTINVTPHLRGKARYLLSGRWFQTSSTNIRISDGVHKRSWALEEPLQQIPRNASRRSVMEQMIYQTRLLKPATILDIASGGG